MKKLLENFCRRYLVATLIIGVALRQLYLVDTDHLSRWKGGGFGMYSEFHPRMSEIWARTGSTACGDSARVSLKDDEPEAFAQAYRHAQNHPNAASLRALVPYLHVHTDTLYLQAWQLRFDPATGTLYRELQNQIRWIRHEKP